MSRNFINLQQCKAKIYYNEHGKFPEESAGAPTDNNDPSCLIIQIGSFWSQRSKVKKAAEQHPDDVVKQEKYAKPDMEVKAVEVKIKLLI